MENMVQKINHRFFGELRIVIADGKVYLVGIDTARALGFKSTDDAIRRHVQKQDKIKFSSLIKGKQPQRFTGVEISGNAILINESGMYSLVMRSNLPQAKEFQHWLTSEVIPSIMRTGTYQMSGYTPSAFTDREKVEMLFKMLNLASTPALKNQLIRHIDFILTMDFYNIAVNE